MSKYLSIKESAEYTRKSTSTIKRLIQSSITGSHEAQMNQCESPVIDKIKRNKSQFKTVILKQFLDLVFHITPQKEETPKIENESSIIEFLKKELEAKGSIIEKFQNQVDTFQEQFTNFQKLENKTLDYVSQLQNEKQQLLIENQKLLDSLQGKQKFVSIPSNQNIEDVESERIENLHPSKEGSTAETKEQFSSQPTRTENTNLSNHRAELFSKTKINKSTFNEWLNS